MEATNDDIITKLDEILKLIKLVSRTPDDKTVIDSKIILLKTEVSKA